MYKRDDLDRPIGRPNTIVPKESIPWIWEGVLAEEAITLLSAPEKIGKTTLLSLLLDRRRVGGQLLGRAVYPGRTILCSEENERLWELRQPPLNFGSDLIFHRPVDDFPTRGRWKRFVDDLLNLSFREDPFDLLVVDTATRFIPLTDRNKRIMGWALSQLSIVAGFPAGVLILNQSRNHHRPLAAYADIVIEIETPRGPELTRRRTFRGVGRYPETLQSVSAELNPAGTDYVMLDADSSPHAPLLTTLQALLRASSTPLSRQEILSRWPESESPPRADSLWRCLTRGCETGLFIRDGEGTKTEAFRYGVLKNQPTDDRLG
jgi:hypothetical protein